MGRAGAAGQKVKRPDVSSVLLTAGDVAALRASSERVEKMRDALTQLDGASLRRADGAEYPREPYAAAFDRRAPPAPRSIPIVVDGTAGLQTRNFGEGMLSPVWHIVFRGLSQRFEGAAITNHLGTIDGVFLVVRERTLGFVVNLRAPNIDVPGEWVPVRLECHALDLDVVADDLATGATSLIVERVLVDTIGDALRHEIEEGLVVGGKRVLDPHAGERP